MKEIISFEDVQKLEVRIGSVIGAANVRGTDKLIRLEVDLGDEQRFVVAGMAEFYKPEHFVGKQVPILVNLAPRSFCGVESVGMLLAADVSGKPVLLHPEADVPPGSLVR